MAMVPSGEYQEAEMQGNQQYVGLLEMELSEELRTEIIGIYLDE